MTQKTLRPEEVICILALCAAFLIFEKIYSIVWQNRRLRASNRKLREQRREIYWKQNQ